MRSLKKITLKELASIIGKQLKKYGIDAVLTGGACVTIYSKNVYVSRDLDFVSFDAEGMPKELRMAMEEVGFKQTPSHFFENPDCPFFIEFVAPPLQVGRESPKKITTMRTKLGSFKLLSPTDCIKDRLAAFYHWDDRQSLEQAKMVAKKHKIDFKELKRWSKTEGQLEKYSIFIKELS